MRREPLGLFHRDRRRAGRIGRECLPRLARPPAQLAASMIRQGPSGRSGGGLGGFVAVAVARRWHLRAWVVLVVKRSAYRRPTYRLGARSELVVEALIISVWPVLPHTAQDGLTFLVGSLLILELSASVVRKAAAGEARLPSRWLMCALCFSCSSTKSSESLRTIASARLVVVFVIICRCVSELLTANPIDSYPSEASRRR